MNIAIIILIAFLPLVIWIFCKRKLHINTFSLEIIWAALLGLLACVPIFLLLTVFSFARSAVFFRTIGGILFQSFILSALVEESIKLLFLVFLLKKTHSQREFFFLSVLLGLSLGGFETIMYAIKDVQILFLRLGSAIIIHGICSGLSSIFYYGYKMPSTATKMRFFLFSVLIHGFYNFFCSFGSFFYLFAFVTLLLGVFIAFRENVKNI